MFLKIQQFPSKTNCSEIFALICGIAGGDLLFEVPYHVVIKIYRGNEIETEYWNFIPI